MTPKELAEIHLGAFGEDRAWNEEQFKTFLADPHIVLTKEEQSFVLGRIVADEAEILTLATAPDHQRRGLAQKSLQKFIAKAQAAGAISIFLEVGENNSPAKALYAGHHFHQVGERKDYYRKAGGHAVTALILKRELP